MRCEGRYMKQYVIKEAYTDNYHVLQYVNGKLEKNNIVSWYELDGYVSALKNMGYIKAYYVPEYKMKMYEAQEELDFATKSYNEAKNSPLLLSDDEVSKYKMITHTEY